MLNQQRRSLAHQTSRSMLREQEALALPSCSLRFCLEECEVEDEVVLAVAATSAFPLFACDSEWSQSVVPVEIAGLFGSTPFSCQMRKQT